jgi:hypothetical protein
VCMYYKPYTTPHTTHLTPHHTQKRECEREHTFRKEAKPLPYPKKYGKRFR